MNPQQARERVAETFPQPFNRGKFLEFSRNLLNKFDESKAAQWNATYVKDAFKPHVSRFERLGTYTSPDDEKLDVLVVHLTNESKLERARTAIRNFVADHLKTRDEKDAALVAFVSPTEQQWRFSYVKMEYAAVETEAGRVGVETRLTPARRYSYIVGEGESCHTAQTRFLALLQDTENYPTLAQLEDAFSVEAVTREFFKQYAALFGDIEAALQKLAAKDKTIGSEFKEKSISTVDFAKKLMGQIVFLYFLQKKGWLGVAKGQDWGTGPHDFLRRLARGDYGAYDNFFNDVLEPLFYDTLATDRGHEAWCNRFKCRIPFLNGGLFEPLADYDWRKTDIILPNRLFTNTERFDTLVTGTGILDVFDRYNFTVNEAEPLEKEVAIDPEMLGKVFENLIEENRRKGLGSFYTPREIVHYMCQESLINYLDTSVNHPLPSDGRGVGGEGTHDQTLTPALSLSERERENRSQRTDKSNAPTGTDAANVSPSPGGEGRGEGGRSLILRADLETFIHLGEQISHYEAVDAKYPIKMPATIEKHARLIDEKLANITVCDPAVGSGAYPVGMMTEIVRARCTLTPYFNDVHERTPYHFKRHAIQNCLYGVDIDPGAVEIAKLRLWLSLVVDEEDVKQIKPLPNLDYKIVVGNSLLGVEKNLFNQQLFQRLEKLKPLYFDQSDASGKSALKQQIEDTIHELTNGKEAFDFEIYFSEVFHRKGGFDVGIANPPYVRMELIKPLKPMLRASYPHIHAERADLYCYFYARTLQLLAKGGVLTYISSNKFFRAGYGEPLRTFLTTNTELQAVIDFNDLPIFDATTYPCIVITRNCQPAPEHQIRTLNVRSDDDLARFADLPVTQLLQKGFAWRLESLATLQLLIKMKAAGELLGNYVRGKIFMGIKSGCNDAFLIDRATRTALIAESPRAAEIIKPYLAGKHVRRWGCERPDLWMLYLPHGVSTKGLEAVFKHLRPYRKQLESRATKQAWYELQQPQEKFTQIYSQPKIIFPDIASDLRFAIDPDGSFFSNTAYCIGSDERYLLAVLNSAVVQYFYIYLSAQIRGGYVRLWTQYVEQIPIPAASPEKQKAVERLVDRILAAKQREAAADTSALEREIDEMVYALYALTPEEIQIVEGAAK